MIERAKKAAVSRCRGRRPGGRRCRDRHCRNVEDRHDHDDDNDDDAKPQIPAHGSAAHEDAEKPVTGDAAIKAKAAAVKAVGSGTAGAVTTDFPGTGYEVTVTKSDGSTVEVHLDSSFDRSWAITAVMASAAPSTEQPRTKTPRSRSPATRRRRRRPQRPRLSAAPPAPSRPTSTETATK